MDPILMTVVSLRGLALLFSTQGHNQVADAINEALTAYEAGRNIDSYMREIADKLALGELDGWEEITARIKSETSEFLSRDSDGQLPEPT